MSEFIKQQKIHKLHQLCWLWLGTSGSRL
jgi:hypothetical protein